MQVRSNFQLVFFPKRAKKIRSLPQGHWIKGKRYKNWELRDIMYKYYSWHYKKVISFVSYQIFSQSQPSDVVLHCFIPCYFLTGILSARYAAFLINSVGIFSYCSSPISIALQQVLSPESEPQDGQSVETTPVCSKVFKQYPVHPDLVQRSRSWLLQIVVIVRVCLSLNRGLEKMSGLLNILKNRLFYIVGCEPRPYEILPTERNTHSFSKKRERLVF